MTRSDLELGMDRSITRRDFLNGVSMAIGGSMVARPALASEAALPQQPATAGASTEFYPPALTGMRGSQPGSMDAAHAMRDGKKWDAGAETGESDHLVVAGGGMSGLAAVVLLSDENRTGRENPDSRQSRRFRWPRSAERVYSRRPSADCQGGRVVHRPSLDLHPRRKRPSQEHRHRLPRSHHQARSPATAAERWTSTRKPSARIAWCPDCRSACSVPAPPPLASCWPRRRCRSSDRRTCCGCGLTSAITWQGCRRRKSSRS